MEIEVDQSYKVEHTNRPTALAFFSPGVSRSLLIPAKVKQNALRYLKDSGRKGHRSVQFLFAAAVFLLIEKDLAQITYIWIDIEYQGHENDIRLVLLNLVRADRPDFSSKQIGFRLIGKKSGAHLLALAVQRGSTQPDRTVTLKDILTLRG